MEQSSIQVSDCRHIVKASGGGIANYQRISFQCQSSVVCFSGDSAEFGRHDGCLANWKRPAEFEIC